MTCVAIVCFTWLATLAICVIADEQARRQR